MAKIIRREWTTKGAMGKRVRYVALFAFGLLLTGCVSYTTPMGGTDTAIADAKQGQDCRLQVGIGGIPDLSGAQAMRQGGITKLRSAEYRENTLYGIGQTCMVAHGQ